MKYDLRKLEQMVRVARAGSFSAAAAQLYVTQPALSRNIAALEKDLGITLFERGRGGVTLTTEGVLAVEAAEGLLRHADSLAHNLDLLRRGDAGRVAFGLGPLLASLVLSDLAREFLRVRPGLQLRAVVKPAPELLQDLLADRIELLVCGREQLALSPVVSVEPIVRLPIAHIVRAGHPLAGRASVDADTLRAYPFLAGAELPGDLAGGGGLACDNYHILHEVALDSDAVWLTYPHMVQPDLAAGRLCELSLGSDLHVTHTEICCVSRAGFDLSPAARHVLTYVQSYLSSPSKTQRSHRG